MKKSRIASPVPHPESSLRHLPLVDLLVDTKTDLLELALRSGRRSSPRCSRRIGRRSAGRGMRTSPSGRQAAPAPPAARSFSVGRKVTIQRPRVRTTAGKVALPTFQMMAATDPLDRRVVEQMLVGVATRQYARSLVPVGPEMKSRGPARARSAAASSRARPRSSRPGGVRPLITSISSRC